MTRFLKISRNATFRSFNHGRTGIDNLCRRQSLSGATKSDTPSIISKHTIRLVTNAYPAPIFITKDIDEPLLYNERIVSSSECIELLKKSNKIEN